jgi:two-component system, OmpR family, response regulator
MDTSLKSKKILMVEDDAAMREIIVHKLQLEGFEVSQAGDGKQALGMIESNRPNLILLDLMLPEMDGFTVLEHVRKHQDTTLSQTPVIILSNLWSNKDILRAKSLKVEAYMVKAYFTTEEILHKVHEILQAQPIATSNK